MVTRESTGGKGLAISSRCWLNAGRATNDCGRTLRVASYEGGKAEEVWEFSGGRDWRRSRKFCGKKRGERRMHQTPPARTFSIHSRIDLKISSSSSMFLSLSLPTPFRSFVRFFVIGMSWSASFQHSFGGHQGRSSFSVFPIPSRRMEIPHRNRPNVNFYLKRFGRQIQPAAE